MIKKYRVYAIDTVDVTEKEGTKAMRYVISIFRDNETEVWIATSSDMPGLILESDSIDNLIEEVQNAASDLIALNELPTNNTHETVDFMWEVSDYHKDPSYKMEISPDTNGTFFVRFPDLPGCLSAGRTMSEAVQNAEDAKECWLAAATEDLESIPKPLGESI